MASDSFRPRKDSNENGLESLKKIQAMRNANAEEMGEEGQTLGSQKEQVVNPNKNFEIKGNLPPEFAQKIQGGDQNFGNKSSVRVKNNNFTNRTNDGSSEISEQLRDVLQKIKQTSLIYEEITLPSLGRFYDGTNGPLDGVLHVRPMIGEDQQIMTSPRLSKNPYSMINMLLSRCTKETQYKPENLLSVDRYYLMIYLRGISESTKYNVEIKCPSTEKRFEYSIDLATLNKNLCPDDFGPTLEDVLPTTKLRFKYRLSTGRDDQLVEEHKEWKLRNFGEESDDTITYRLALLVEEIEGITSKKEIETILKNLVTGDLNYLRNKINDPPFGIETKIPVVSPYSLEEFEVDMPIDANFFFPRQRKENDQS